MLRKFWTPGTLSVNDNGDGAGGGDGDGDGGAGGETDVSKLQAKYDTQVASLTKTISDLQAKVTQAEGKEASNTTYSRVLMELTGKLEGIDPSKPENISKVLEIAGEFADAAARNASQFADLQFRYKNVLANGLAQAIAAEHGGSVSAYEKELLGATTEAQMRTLQESISTRVASDKKKPSSNGGNEPKRGVDNGAGSAARKSVQDKLASYDVSTPEGRAAFAKDEKALKAEVDKLAV